jgi:hypothetical protein
MDMYTKDNTLDEVYWINDYNMNITEGYNYVDVSLTGRYYDPNYGYVDISTPTYLRIYDDDFYPSSGAIFVEGSSSSATLTALSSTTYQITADFDGDDVADYNSDVLYW